MNCKPGDLAYVTVIMHTGKVVNVLEAAPHIEFRLPDGQMSVPGDLGDWVIEMVTPPVVVRLSNGLSRVTRFGLINDRYLRPIRDQPGEDEMLRIAGKPSELPADVTREVTA